MPSHIFVQRGMWEDVRKSNIVAYKAATELNARMKLAEGREDFHTLGWLQYANLMLGNIDEAKANVESAKQAADRNPGQRRHPQRLSRHARAADSRNREVGTRSRSMHRRHPVHADAHAGMPGMRACRCRRSNTWTFIAGYSAAKLGDLATAERAVAMLRGAREKLEAGPNPYSGQVRRDHGEAGRRAGRNARGQKDEALKLAKEAMDIELALSAPSGPPDPIKPAPEFYGELLIEAGKHRGSCCRTGTFAATDP